jgi:hypothetical protein
MSLTTQHFEAFAEFVANEELMGTDESMVERLCGVLDRFGKNFDKERFIARCDELQGFERGDLSFPISQDKMPLLTLYSLERALFNAETDKGARLCLQECIDTLKQQFPHLEEN